MEYKINKIDYGDFEEIKVKELPSTPLKQLNSEEI